MYVWYVLLNSTYLHTYRKPCNPRTRFHTTVQTDDRERSDCNIHSEFVFTQIFGGAYPFISATAIQLTPKLYYSWPYNKTYQARSGDIFNQGSSYFIVVWPTMSCFADWSKCRNVTLSIIVCSPLHVHPGWHYNVTRVTLYKLMALCIRIDTFSVNYANAFYPARHYASAVPAMVLFLCRSVGLSLCFRRKSDFFSKRSNESKWSSAWRFTSTYRTLLIGYFPSETVSNSGLVKFYQDPSIAAMSRQLSSTKVDA